MLEDEVMERKSVGKVVSWDDVPGTEGINFVYHRRRETETVAAIGSLQAVMGMLRQADKNVD
jgi:hypothetical protein